MTNVNEQLGGDDIRSSNRVGMVFMLLANIMVNLVSSSKFMPSSSQAETFYIGVTIVLFFGGFWLYLRED